MKGLFSILLLTFNFCIAQVNLNAGLKAYYPFSGNANDVSGNNLNGTIQGGVQLTTDRFGNANSAYHFNGIDSRIIIQDNGALSTPAFSICYYFNTEVIRQQVCIGKIEYSTGYGATYNSVLYHPVNATPFFSVIDPTSSCTEKVLSTYAFAAISPNTIQTNQWYCVVNTFENGIQKLYVDGVLVRQQNLSFTQAKACNNTNFLIGSWWQGDLYSFQGKMDDVRFYDRAINQQEVNSLCNQITSLGCSNWLNTPAVGATASFGDLDVPGNQITVEAIINRTQPYVTFGTDNTEGDVVSKHNSPADVNYLLRPNDASITTTDGFFITPDICQIEINKTYHIAMVYDGSTLKFYRDGYLMSQVNATGNLFQNNWNTKIGLYDPSFWKTQFIGFTNEVRIWNIARTQAQLNAFMNLPLVSPTTQPGLVAYYTFDDLVNKQGNTAFNGILAGGAAINQTNTNCTFVADSCILGPVVNPCNFDFSYKQDICNPLSVQFEHIGTAPVNTYWSFGDGNTITGNTNPTHLYNSAGNYIVKYANSNGTCTDTIVKTISVNILAADIISTADTTICINTTKQLHTIPALSFCWSPTTYLDNPNLPNPTTSATAPITYYFTAEMPGSNIIANGDFNLGNTGFSSQYNFANPNTTEGEYFVGPNPQSWNASLSSCPDHTGGTGNMLLVNGAPLADVNVWTQTVTVTPNTNYAFSTWIQALYPPNPAQLSFSINGGTLGSLITASLPTCTWNQFYTTWNSGNNISATIAIVNKNTQVQGNDFALDDISFSPVLIKRDSVKIAVNTPKITATADTAICIGKTVQLNTTGAISYSWAPATGLSNNAIANPIATPAATTQYIVSGINASGCTAKDTVNITSKPLPLITKSADAAICHNTTTQLVAGGGTSYAWTPAASLNNPSIANPIASPTVNTTYIVTITGANSCSNTDSIKITIQPLPVFTISANQSTCLGNSVTLAAGGGSSYLWSPAAMVNNPASSNPATNITTTTTFTVKIKNNTCNDSTSLTTTVVVSPLPTVKATKLNDIDCVFSSARLLASGASTYTWSPSTGLDNPNIANPLATITSPQQYQVSGTDAVTKCTGKDTITVFIKALADPSFFVPNAFSPNGDGINDCFRVNNFGTVKTADISIYNRYGTLVFHSTNVSDCWNGSFKGKPVSAGNYVYYIRTFNDCGSDTKKGNLLLIR